MVLYHGQHAGQESKVYMNVVMTGSAGSHNRRPQKKIAQFLEH